MAQVAFKELMREVLSTAPNCPTMTVERALRNAAIELGDMAGCFRYELDGQLALGGLVETEFDLPRDTNLVKVISLHANGNLLEPYSIRMMDRDRPSWREDKEDQPKKYFRRQNTMNAIRLWPTPTETVSLEGEVAIKPARDATGLEEVYFDRFQNTLINGALAHLLVVPNAPWFSAEAAAYHRQMFDAEKDEAKRVADADDIPKRRTITYGGM